ncbi:golgin subfamily A member 4 isoform X2 [Morus notabilis]|uniref:golgin subfamily A member 4 isoform X2 n=2 Tax=Morus notabilis TaxID=981085 RepID=UPI000CED5D67|nr:golgin subfamily A member 4 isoform X2 [Morus notabilis]
MIRAMQEADGLQGRHSDHNGEIKLDGDNKLPLSKVGGSAEAILGTSLAESSVNASCETEQIRMIDEVSTSDGANMSDDLSGSALVSSKANISSVSPAEVEQQSSSAMLASIDEEKSEPSFRSDEFGERKRDEVEDGTGYERVAEGYNQQHRLDNDEKPMETNLASSAIGLITSPCPDLSSISLPQLIDLFRGLSEEKYVLLLKSRDLVSSRELGANNLTIPDNGTRHLLERLKEELFLTNFTKDIFQLQLAEHSNLQVEFDHEFHQSQKEICRRNDLLKEVTTENQCLTEELSQCRHELQASLSAREELQNLFHTSKAEVEELSARAHELQIHLERSQGDLLSLSTELADSKQLVASLQVENENLNATIALVTEERRTLGKEKDFYFEENKKLLTELDDCKKSVAALQLENSNLTTDLSSVAAEKKMLDEEKENLSREHEKLSTEFADIKELGLALQQDNSSLRESLTLVTEERKKLEDDKKSFALESDRLSSELLILQEQSSNEKRERERVEVELKEVTMRLEQLTKENSVLLSSLDIHKETLIEADSNRLEMHVQSRESVHQVEISEARREDDENAIVGEDSFGILGKQVPEVCSSSVQKPLCDGNSTRTFHVFVEKEGFYDSLCVVALKGHLEEMEKTLHQLEKDIERVHTFSASFSKPGGKLPAPAVSKLIQAFESKVHIDEHEAEEMPLTENKSTAGDPFVLTKEEIKTLRALYEHLVVDVADAFVMLKGERDGRRTAEVSVGELKDQYEALEDHSKNLEASNIELAVQCEVIKQHGSSVEATNNELVVLCEATKKEVAYLKIENTEFGSKLRAYELRIGDLQRQLYDLQQTSNEKTAVISTRLEDLQKEVSERVLMLEKDWNSILAQVVEIVQKLGESVGNFSLTVSAVDNGSDVVSLVAAAVNSTTKVIEDMQKKLEAAHTDYEVICTSYKEVNVRCDDLHQKNDIAFGILHDIHGNLRKLVRLHGSVDESEISTENEKLLDPLDYRSYETFMGQLEHFLSERLELESVIKNLNLELMERREEFKELNRGCLSENVICKLITDVEGVLKLEDAKIYSDKVPASRFESLLSILVQNYKEADVKLGLSKEEFGSKALKLTELKEEVQQLTALCLQHETEIYVLKESLNQVQESLFAAGSGLQKKASELEQSEQRVLSIREKLSIAVTKGKGLVVQRDGLKQSLAETSSELERYLQELQLKDARLHEVETKLKTYSEAGERVEALESELSYIRNSATALRESFLLKDSVLQRIEEILEDLDLPEQFHSRDIIEKVDWLARSATGNVLPPTDWDQKSSAGGGSYSDAGFVVMEPWKDDAQSSSMSGEDLKRKYEELQSKFYGLAEQNDMLEQSLMERNNLVQKWEELLDRIDMPSQLRSVEPEDRIQWLGRALSEAHHDSMYLQQKVVNLETYCGTLNTDMEDLQRRIYELESNLEAISKEKGFLSERLDILSHEYDKVSSKATQYEVENKRLQGEVTSFQENHEGLSAKVAEVEFENRRLQNEVTNLQENVAEMRGNEECILSIEGEIRRLQSLVSDVLQDPGMQDQVSSGSSIENLEVLLRKLLDNYANFSSEKTVLDRAVEGLQTDVMMTEEAKSISKPDGGESDIAILKKELEEALSDLTHVKDERDGYVEKQRSLACEIEALVKRTEELELLLNQEEQKSASVREKLNVAVRKGKSLVQQRDSLKQTIEEMNAQLENLKAEIDIRGNRLSEYERKFGELSTYPERVKVLESEILFLKNHLTETEQHLQETGHTLSMILNILAEVDVGDGVNYGDPIKKFEQIVKLWGDLRADVAFSVEESRKSKRAAELLLAELNEVQERNDSLQEELANAASELSELSKERDVAEAAKLEALSRLEEFYNVHSLDQRNQLSELKGLKSGIDNLRKDFHDVGNLLADVFVKDLEFLHHLETGIDMCLKRTNATDVASGPLFDASVGVVSSSSDRKGLFSSIDSWLDSSIHGEFDGDSVTEICSSLGSQLQEVIIEVGVLKEKLNKHSSSLHEKASSLSKLMENAHREIVSHNETCEALKRDIMHMESTEKEKDKELGILQKNIALLFEALSSSLMEIESMKPELLGNNLATGDSGINSKPSPFAGGGISFGGSGQVSSEESIRTLADKLLFAVRDFAGIKAEIVEGRQKQMKNAITDLQKELQEKEIQKERICMELVSQIKAAEAAAARSSLDLQSSRTQVVDLEKQLEVMGGERNLLEQRVKVLEDAHATSTELEQNVRSLNDIMAAKDQEIEALMQALDEEESQMEGLMKKIEELEKVLEQKNLDLENLEASRGKVTKKLSITVSKFDELHQLSASLLAEVEKLQSQLQDRDAEISFLRQEVTRCTNDALVASQMSNNRDSDDFHEFLTWFDMMISNVGTNNVHPDIKNNDWVYEHKELLQKKIESVLSDLVDLREVAQSKDTLLQVERSKVDELTRKEEILERSLRDKESRLNFLEGVETSEMATGVTSEIMEVEPMINKWTVPSTPVASQVRSLRKGNNEQVAIAIDMDPGSSTRLEDEDDDKVHGFKSLTTSSIVPKFTRPVSDMVDGLWVSCDRALMRQPAFRLGIILYWVVLHALLATFAV